MAQIFSKEKISKLDRLIYESKKSLFILFIFSIFFGYTLNSALHENHQEGFNPEWGGATWITPQTKSVSAYFRHTFTLQQQVSHAHITLSATEEYNLTVNGKKVQEKKFLAKNLSDIVDISKYLQPGKNVIGIIVDRHTKGTIPAVIAKIKWQNPSGESGIIVTDTHWRSRHIDETFHEDEPSWLELDYNDWNWKESRKLEFSTMDSTTPVTVNPYVYEVFPNGQWISDYTISYVTNFHRELDLDSSEIESVWIGVSANGIYSLTINDNLLSKVNEDVSENIMNVMDITPYMIDGKNQLSIQVLTEHSLPKLLVSGVVFTGDRQLSFSSDEKWTSDELYLNNKLLNSVPLNTSTTPELKFLKVLKTRELKILKTNKIAIYTALTFFLSLLTYSCFIFYSSAINKKLLQSTLRNIYSAPYITATSIIIGIILIKNPFYLFGTYNFKIYSLIVIIFLLLYYQIIIFREIYNKTISNNNTEGYIGIYINKEQIYIYSIIILLIFAFLLRIWGLGDQSFFQDESTILQFTHGFLEKGYPHLYRDQDERLMVTYELMPYLIAFSISFFGESEFTARLPSVLFSLGTLVLILYISRHWYRRSVAYLAALLYAITPWSIFWAQNLFYPSQIQFFALIATWFFIELLKTKNNRTRDWYLMALFFCLTYFTWEGSGLLLLVYGLMWLFSNRWDWLKNFHLWMMLVIVGSLIFFQLYHRTMLKESFLAIGSSNADISTPQLAFTQPGYDSFYYLDNIFFSEQFLVLTCVFILGFIIYFKKNNFTEPYSFVLLTIAIYTLLLPATALRYVYFVLPFFLIAVAATTIKVFETIFPKKILLISVFRANKATEIIITSILVLSGGSYFFKPTEFSKDAFNATSAWEIRNDIPTTDYRGIIKKLDKFYQKGDIVITRAPFLLDLYTEIKSNYSIQSLLTTTVVYGIRENDPYYRDKWIGNPVLRNIQEFKDILYRHNRVWLLVVPSGTFLKSIDSEIAGFFKQNFVLKAESDHSSLYLWER